MKTGLLVAAALVAAFLLVSGDERADPRTPPALPGEPPPFLGTAVVGGGGLTAAIDAYGDVVDLRVSGPGGRGLIDNPAERQAAGTVPADTGVVPWVSRRGGATRPLWTADSVDQRYRRGTNVVVTTARFGQARVRVVYAASRSRLACLVEADGVAGVEPRASRPPAERRLRCDDGVARATIRDAERSDRGWLQRAQPLGSAAPPWADELYERSLLVLHALTDRRSGAIVAGARDGWAYVWPRDAAAAALAFAAAGYRGEARRGVRFLLGLDLGAAARFYGDGEPVPGRGPQGDAGGWVAVAAQAVGLSPPPRLPWRNLPDYQEGEPGDYLGNTIAAGGAKTGLHRSESSRRLVRRLGDPGSGLDSAAAWAVKPFGIRPLYPAARATMLRLARRGGRFGITPGENWPGIDPWSAPTAWTAWSLAALGERRQALHLLADLRRAATPAGTLPERVDFGTGVPTSTTPLVWSHAFAILALRELWPGRTGLEGCQRRGDCLLGGLGGDDAGAAGHALAAVELPAAQGDDLVADDAGEADLRERPPLAADRDHRLAGGDDGEVAGVADAGGDDVAAVRVGVVGGGAGDDPDHLAACLGRRSRGGLHHAASAAADDGDAGFRQPATDPFSELPGLRALLDPAAADHSHLALAPHSSPRISPISSSAPALCSGSLRLPHFGLCTQEGQPDSQGHSAISRSASPSRRSNSS